MMKGSPAAVLGAATFAKTVAEPPPLPTDMGRTIGLLNKCSPVKELSPLDILRNRKRQAFYKAREAAGQIYRRRMHLSHGGVSPNQNILALKSVSPQHKIHMYMAWEYKIQNEQKSWLQKLAEQFGYEDESNYESGGSTDAQPANLHHY